MAAKQKAKTPPHEEAAPVSRPGLDLGKALGGINDGICLLSVDRRVLFANRAMATMFGVRLEKILGHPCFEVVHGTKRPIKGCPVEKMRKSLMRETMELERKGRWLDVTVDPLLDDTGELVGILHIVRDITGRKKTEESLRNALAFNREMISSIGAGVLVYDRQIRYVEWNWFMEQLTGMKKEEVIGRKAFGLFPHLKEQGIDRVIEQALAGETVVSPDMNYRIPATGKEGWTVGTYAPHRNAQGEIIGVIGLIKDITERKRAEEALRESEEKYRILAESSPEMIFLVDGGGVVRYVNNAALAMFRGGRETVVGKHLDRLFPPAVAKQHLKDIRAVIESGRLFFNEFMEEFPTGKRWISARLSPVRDGAGKTIGVLGLSADITGRKLIEQELRRSQEHYQDLVETAQDLIFQYSIEGKFLYLNPAWEKVLGYTLDEMLGHPFTEFMPEDRALQALEDLTRSLDKGIIRGYETEYVAKNGRRVSLIFNAKFTKGADGAVNGLSGTAYDITERKKVEEALRRSEEKFRAIIEQNSEGIILIDEECRIIEWNPAIEKMTGIPAARAMGVPVWEVQGRTALPERWTPERAERMKRMFLDAVQTGWSPLFSAPVEAVMVRNGERVHVQQTVFPIKTERGYRLGSIMRDVTERKRAEEALRRSEEKYRALFESAGDAIMIARMGDKGPSFIDVNTRALALFGMTREEMNRSDPAALSPEKQPDGRPSAEAMLENVAKVLGGETVVTEWVHRKKDGTEFPCELTLTAIGYTGERVIQATVRDITERKKLEERMARDEKLESLQVFAGGIAHDFNNLLAGIFGNIDLARLELPDNNPAQRYLNNAFMAFGRAKHLAQQLLTFAKGGAPQKRPLRLPELVVNASTLALSGSNVKAEFDFADGLWPVDGDENQLSQVISNILINAAQAMPQGGVVTVAAENHTLKAGEAENLPAGRYVAVTIEDRGVGIPAAIIDKIFDPFFTTKQQGSGLGLATSYSIINRHGGALEVASHPGRGTVFTAWVPASEKALAADDEGGPAEADLRGTGRILVMDDESLIRRVVYDMLSMAGYEVTTAPDGREVVEKYRAAFEIGKKYDLVILDLTVPGGMGGMDAVKEILKTDPHALAVVSSGYADNAAMADYAGYGFAARVPKPYSMKELLQTVKSVLESRNR